MKFNAEFLAQIRKDMDENDGRAREAYELFERLFQVKAMNSPSAYYDHWEIGNSCLEEGVAVLHGGFDDPCEGYFSRDWKIPYQDLFDNFNDWKGMMERKIRETSKSLPSREQIRLKEYRKEYNNLKVKIERLEEYLANQGEKS